MRDAHCLRRTVNKSFWSFLDRRHIQHAFQVVTVEVVQYRNNSTSKVTITKFAPNGFVDAFTDLLFDINACPPGTPITVEWNPNLPRYDSTCDTQVFKTFTDLPKDLPFVYGSLTVTRTSFRPWLGPKSTAAFHVPGMEFFATTGEYKN
jgi:hypothetical protein